MDKFFIFILLVTFLAMGSGKAIKVHTSMGAKSKDQKSVKLDWYNRSTLDYERRAAIRQVALNYTAEEMLLDSVQVLFWAKVDSILEYKVNSLEIEVQIDTTTHHIIRKEKE